MPRILVADDDVLLSDMIADNLAKHGYKTELVRDGGDAMQLVRSQSFDLLILDWNMPGATGIEICRKFRQIGKNEPVIMLTARSEIEDKEEGLYAGADDYLTKPFDIRELIARIKSLLRRPANYMDNLEKLGPITIDFDGRILRKGEIAIRLQPRELDLLQFFMRRPGQLLGAEALLSGVWGSDFEGSEIALRSCLAKLRKALSALGHNDVIQTVHGFGYRFVAPAD